MRKRRAKLQLVQPPPLKIDIGCGPNKREGFIGLDKIKFPGVDHIHDAARERWPFDDASVEEAYTSHFVEHLDRFERIFFANELHRVLVVGGKCMVITPHWASCRAYGDMTHRWPPVSEFWPYYLNQEWRDKNAPHNDAKWWVDGWPGGYTCDFDHGGGFNLHPAIVSRNDEFKSFATTWYKEAAADMICTLTKR